MKCPFCGCDDTQVKDSRDADDGIVISIPGIFNLRVIAAAKRTFHFFTLLF